MTATCPWRTRGPAAVFTAAGLVVAVAITGASAETIQVPAGIGNLGRAIATAAPGDVLELGPGVHEGPVEIAKPLILEGKPGAVIDGKGAGRTLDVTATDVTVRGLTLRGSGIDYTKLDAAIFLHRTAARAVVEDNDIDGNLVGVFVHGPADAIVRHNTIVGRTDLRMNDRGNGVYLWNSDRTQVLDNDISGGRDGIFTNVSRNAVFHGNRIHGVRFAVHYMYTNDSEVSDNISIGNHAGFAIMFSDGLKILNNISYGDRDHGFLFNYANRAQISGNAVHGGDKCVFIYNANFNIFTDNWFQGCRIGVHFTAGSEQNTISGNAFIGNEVQVKYVGTRSLDWSKDGRGNYWSDNPAFDLNGDGIADSAYRPNDIVDQVVWRYPAAKLLLNSPGIQAVRWAQSQFPAIHPGGVIDSAPLIAPPDVPAARFKPGESAVSVSERSSP